MATATKLPTNKRLGFYLGRPMWATLGGALKVTPLYTKLPDEIAEIGEPLEFQLPGDAVGAADLK